MSVSNFISPITSSDWDDLQFSMFDGSFDSTLDFFVNFPSKTDVTLHVSNTDVSFESSSLTGGSLFLNWFKTHNFFFEFLS